MSNSFHLQMTHGNKGRGESWPRGQGGRRARGRSQGGKWRLWAAADHASKKEPPDLNRGT